MTAASMTSTVATDVALASHTLTHTRSIVVVIISNGTRWRHKPDTLSPNTIHSCQMQLLAVNVTKT